MELDSQLHNKEAPTATPQPTQDATLHDPFGLFDADTAALHMSLTEMMPSFLGE